MSDLATIRPFPFSQVAARADLPVAELAAPSTDGHPWLTDEDGMHELFWRIKRWKMEFTVTWTMVEDVTPPTDPWTGVFSYAGSFEADALSGDEEDLVVAMTLSFTKGDALVDSVNWTHPTLPSYTDDAPSDFYLTLFPDFPKWKLGTGDGEFYPRIELYGRFGFDGQGIRFDVEGTPTDTITFNGDTIDVAIDSTNPGYTTTFSATIAIVPTEWWEYDPGDGDGPIYDSSDGTRTARTMPNP